MTLEEILAELSRIIRLIEQGQDVKSFKKILELSGKIGEHIRFLSTDDVPF